MKLLFSFLSLIFCSSLGMGQEIQDWRKGTVSYVSSQNVYVKFSSTEGIEIGDTLFVKENEQTLPCLIVKSKSSTSCVNSNISPRKFAVQDEVLAKVKSPSKSKEEPFRETNNDKPAAGQDSMATTTPAMAEIDVGTPALFKQKIKGRISAASFSTFSNGEADHRMRYALTFQGNNIGNSRFSTDNYIVFRHTIGEWQEVQNNFSDAFKVYALSIRYDIDRVSHVDLGRRINPKISSLGAIDGLQLEKGFGRWSAGAILGSRPDYMDYGLNLNLLQGGAYLSHTSDKTRKFQQSTLAIVEQRNHSKTDRRFVYFQHSDALLNNLNIFTSFEFDLYKNIRDTVSNTFDLTNFFVSLRYRISKKLNLGVSYDARKNIIYYESYKNYIDQIIDNETRQGLRFSVNYRLLKQVSLGINAGWRFQKSRINESKNINAYLNFSKVPWLDASASLTINLLQTGYLDSEIYGGRISKELIRGKLSSDLYFRMVNYRYKQYENSIIQKIAGLDFGWNISRKLSFHTYYEGTFEKNKDAFSRFNTRIIQRL